MKKSVMRTLQLLAVMTAGALVFIGCVNDLVSSADSERMVRSQHLPGLLKGANDSVSSSDSEEDPLAEERLNLWKSLYGVYTNVYDVYEYYPPDNNKYLIFSESSMLLERQVYNIDINNLKSEIFTQEEANKKDPKVYVAYPGEGFKGGDFVMFKNGKTVIFNSIKVDGEMEYIEYGINYIPSDNDYYRYKYFYGKCKKTEEEALEELGMSSGGGGTVTDLNPDGSCCCSCTNPDSANSGGTVTISDGTITFKPLQCIQSVTVSHTVSGSQIEIKYDTNSMRGNL